MTAPGPIRLDRLTRTALLVIAAALAWLAAWTSLTPLLAPRRAEAQREALAVNLERIGGRYLTGGAVPVRCADLRP